MLPARDTAGADLIQIRVFLRLNPHAEMAFLLLQSLQRGLVQVGSVPNEETSCVDGCQ